MKSTQPAQTLCLAFLFATLLTVSSAFRIGVPMPPPLPFSDSLPIPSPGAALSSSLISKLAVAALTRRLDQQTDVSCNIAPSNLLGGKVGPVTVKGRSWKTRLGLTCQAIEATVHCCELDMLRVVKSRKLALTRPASGTARIELDATDFGNFLMHPNMKIPNNIKLLKHRVTVDRTNRSISFSVDANGNKSDYVVRKDIAKGLVVRAVNSNMAINHEVAKSLQRFLSNMEFEVDGIVLSLRDFSINKLGRIMLALDLTISKFPSHRAEF